MKYLFFDLEYASQNGGISKICEFGYIVTNDEFEIIKRNNLIINPNIGKYEWDYRILRKILTRTIKEYEESPAFYAYYDNIKKLIVNSDYIFGHSLDSDAKALNDDCKRYVLPGLDYSFWDVKQFYKSYSNTARDTSVIKMLEELSVQGEENVHDAETDAFNTMLTLKAMLDTLNISMEELMQLCPEVENKTENYIVKSIKENQERRAIRFKESLSGDGSNDIKKHGINKKRYIQFLDNVKPQSPIGNKFAGKKLSISINYEEHHFRQMLNLVQFIVNEGGTLVLKASLSDIFVKYDIEDENGALREDSREKYVIDANSNGSSIEIIEFDELPQQLKITEEELDAMPMVAFDFILSDDAIIKDKNITLRKKTVGKQKAKSLVYSSREQPVITIGDIFGDLLKDLKEAEINEKG